MSMSGIEGVDGTPLLRYVMANTETAHRRCCSNAVIGRGEDFGCE